MQDDISASPLKVFFRQKWVRIILCLNVVVVLVLIGIAIYNSTKSAIIVFDVTPVDAKISINGSTGYTNGTYRLNPGVYKIEISYEGLDSKSFELDLTDQSSMFFSTFLSADGGKDFSFYEERANYNSAQKLFSIASSENNQTYDNDVTAEQFVNEYGATVEAFNNELPIVESLRESPDAGGRLLSILSIRQEESCIKYTCVLVSGFGFPDVKERANKKLEETGIDMKYLEVKYE